jgi:hypothetical protein
VAGVNIVDFGKAAQQYGWVVGENPAFGTGRVGGHAPGSYHYSGKAVDITAPTNVDVAPAYPGGKPISWQQRTGELKYRLGKLGQLSEVLGPGDPGHATHVHAALADTANLTPQQLQWAFTGRTKDASGKLTDVMPGSQSAAQAVAPTAAATGNTYNFILQNKKENPDTTNFLSDYASKLIEDSGSQDKAFFNPLSMLASAFNAKGTLMT